MAASEIQMSDFIQVPTSLVFAVISEFWFSGFSRHTICKLITAATAFLEVSWPGVLGKMPPGKMPPGKLPRGNKPPRKIAPQKIAPRKIAPQENCPPENCLPSLPLKKYFVKLLHVMEYLTGENFVNFNFRQS